MAAGVNASSFRCTVYPWKWVIGLAVLNSAVGLLFALNPNALMLLGEALGIRSVEYRLPLLTHTALSSFALLIEAAVLTFVLPQGAIGALAKDLESVPSSDRLRLKMFLQPVALLQLALIGLAMSLPTLGFETDEWFLTVVCALQGPLWLSPVILRRKCITECPLLRWRVILLRKPLHEEDDTCGIMRYRARRRFWNRMAEVWTWVWLTWLSLSLCWLDGEAFPALLITFLYGLLLLL